MMSPGTYIRKRREAAALSLETVATRIAALPWAIRPVSDDDINRLKARIAAAELDQDNLTVIEASLVRNAFRFDVEVYEALLLNFHLGAASYVAEPQLCRECACSWNDACVSDRGNCAWSATDEELCTHCERRARLEAELELTPDAFTRGDCDPVADDLCPATAFAVGRELGRPVYVGAGPADAHQRSLQP